MLVTLLREQARPGVIREHRWAPWLAVPTVCFGAFMGQLDASIVTLAFPALQRQFGVSLAGVQWVSLAYLLVLVVLLVPVGRWSDRYGRKLVYLYGFVLFSAASAACGLTQSLAVLVGLRVMQAAGAAMLQANSVALVATNAPPAVTVISLALLGAGLGAYIPANNHQVMAAIPAGDAATAGGMVNMTRGLGTALGVAVVTLALHAGAHLGHADGERLAIAALTTAALAATWAGTRPSTAPTRSTTGGGRQNRLGGLR